MFEVDIQCILTAILFSVGTVVEIISDESFERAINRSELDRSTTAGSSIVDLDPVAVANIFGIRSTMANLEMAACLINVLAWVLFAIVIVRLAILLTTSCSKSKMIAPTAAFLAVVATVAAFTEAIATIMYLGMMKSLEIVAETRNMDVWLKPEVYGGIIDTEAEYPFDGLGWKTLEMIRASVTGLLVFIQAAEFLFFAGITILVGIIVLRTGKFSNEWAATGFVIALLSIAEFVAATFAFVGGPGWAQVSTTLGGVNRMVLLPFWLFWLGCMIPSELESRQRELSVGSINRLGGIWALERR